jgi:neutral ceramidase
MRSNPPSRLLGRAFSAANVFTVITDPGLPPWAIEAPRLRRLSVSARALVVAILLSATLFFSLTSTSSAALEMKAGAAKAVITPADPLGRITVMGGPIKGVKHDIYARVLTLFDGQHRMVMVTYDLNCLDVATPILRSRCLHELGIDPAYLVLMATHNHAAPIQIVPDNFDYGRWLADRIFALIKEAIAAEQGPVKIYFGSGHTNLIRSDPRYPQIYGLAGKPIDTEIQLLKITKGETPIALLFSVPSHPMANGFSQVSASHPGLMVEEVEKQDPGALALYTDACGADQFIKRGAVMVASEATVASIARDLAATVDKIARGPMTDVTGPLSSKLQVIALPLAPPVSLAQAQKLARKIPTDIGLVPYPDPRRETNWIRALLQHYQENIPFPQTTADRACNDDGFLVREIPDHRDFPCVYEETIVAMIGPLVFVSMQGEVCSPIGLALKNAYRDRHPIWVSAYMGEHNLYIPTRDLVRINAYESKVIQIQYASPVGWAPEVESEMVKGVKKMIDQALTASSLQR